MSFNVATFYAAGLPIALLCGVLQLLFWLRDRRQVPLILWAAGDFIGLLGAALIVARDHVPWWVSSALANSLIVGASFFVWAGMLSFSRLRIPVGAFAAATLLFFAIFHGLWFVSHDLALRVLITSIALGLVNAGIALDLMRGQQRQRLVTRTALAALFALHALFYLFRCATAVTLEADDEFLRSGGIQNAAIVTGVVKLVVWNVAVLLMLREGRRVPVMSLA